jgi:rSAM/selenodomain-associated transferase 1
VKPAASRPALVIAAKAPRAGAVKTRLAGAEFPPERAAELAAAFLRDTVATARHPSVRADVLLALDGDEADLPPDLRTLPILRQRGNDLGERLVGIFGDRFGEGRTAVCVVGSDAPHLPAAFLAEAFGRLRRADTDVVLGPADDGGYYLVGLKEPRPALFAQIPWSTAGVLEATRERARADGLRVALLPPWYDIDTLDDLARLRRDLARGTAVAPETDAALRRMTTG